MIADVKPWVRARMTTLGYTEHTDGFSWTDIPATKLQSTYHIELGDVSEVKNSVDILECEVPFTLRLFIRGSSNPLAGIDSGAALADGVIAEFLKPSNRLGGQVIKNVRFQRCRIEPVANSNDNSIIVRSDWTSLVAMGTRGN